MTLRSAAYGRGVLWCILLRPVAVQITSLIQRSVAHRIGRSHEGVLKTGIYFQEQ